MDTFLFCLLAAFAVACGLKIVSGEGDHLSPGLAVRQGEPSSVIAQKNGELLLNCSVEYDTELGPPGIAWLQDGQPVEEGKRVQLMSNGSLYIRRIIHRPKKNRTDAGVYDCIASLQNIGSIIARRVRVQVAGIEKKFTTEPQPQSVPVGGVARFQCHIDAVPPAIYIWEKDGTQLPQEDSRFIKLSSGILQIIKVQEEDTGSYRCHATQGSLHELPETVDNIYGKNSEEARLEVVKATEPRPVKIITTNPSVTAKVGTTAILECLVDGYSGTVQWKRESNGQEVEYDNRIKRVANNLKFVDVEVSDAGSYQCVAGQEYATLELNVITPPVLTKKPASQKYPKARWIYIDCDANGTPKPTITWLQNGLPIPIKNSFQKKGNQLVIIRADTSHSGFYQCLVENEAGFELAFGRLEISLQSDAPDPPENIRVVSVTKSEIFVTWDHAKTKPCCPVLAYTVHYSAHPGGEWKDEVTQKTQVVLKELEPFTNYSIYVMVYSSVGAGLASEYIYARTLEDVPSKPVTFTLEPRDTSILVKWDELPVQYRKGLITEYRISYKRVDAVVPVENLEQGIPSTARSFLIKNLQPNTEFAVRMKAGTQVGFKTFQESDWPWVPIRTLAVPGLLPSEMEVVPINETAVNLTWTHGDNGKIKSFVIQVRNLSADSGTTVLKLAPETRHYVLGNLVTEAMYEVTLVKEEIDGNTSLTAVEFQTSNALLPPAPTNLLVTFTSSDSLNLEWSQPESDKEIAHYTVKYYELLDGEIPGNPRMTKSQYNSILLEGLNPYTRYKMFVRAHTEHLMSQFSRPVIGWTKEGVPSAPLNIKITSSQPGSVCVEWSPPAEPNGKITSYIIQYSDTLDTDEESWSKVTKNGSVNSAIISISDVAGKTYFFKVYASTQSGQGTPSNPVTLDPGMLYTEKTDPNTENKGSGEDQTLGILIGVSIGVFCIIVCIVIILLRNKYFPTNHNPAPQTQPARCHGNGHIPGNGHAVPLRENPHAVGMYELETYTPMLGHLPENENCDSKGGGGGNFLLTPNGAKLNGFFPLAKNGTRNGQLPNGHMTSVLTSQYRNNVLDAEETRGLIAAMIGGGQKEPPCLSGRVTEDSFTRGRYEDLGSLDDIDRSQEDISNGTLKTSQGEIHTDGKISQEESYVDKSSSSLSASGMEENSDSLDCVGNRQSVSRSDTTDTGDTVIFRGAAISHDGSISDRQQSMSENSEHEFSGGEMSSASGADRRSPSSNNLRFDDCSGAVLPRSFSENLSEEEEHYNQVSNKRSDAVLPQKKEVMHRGYDASPHQKPQNQLSTSNKSHVLRSNVVKDSKNIADDKMGGEEQPIHPSNGSSQCPPPSYTESNASAARVPTAVPHMHMNGGPHWASEHGEQDGHSGRHSEQSPQGDLHVAAGKTRHNHIPHSTSLPHGGAPLSPPNGRASTLAELPQDVKKSRSESSSLTRHHYVV